jgi:hypothetical protein
METIVIPDSSFDFSKLSLAHPSSIQGGAYFTKILYNDAPLYIQTSKCLTKQSIVKSGKKFYCELMFDNNAEQIINWFENLENKCQQLLLDKNEKWFQNTLDLNDIESAFTSIIRVYKSGKYYLVRTNVKSNLTNDPSIKIYNENEVAVGVGDLTPETNIISILEIQGIKFTTRNFQIDIECKQIMVIKDEPIFDNCLIKTNKTKPQIHLEDAIISSDSSKERQLVLYQDHLESLDENIISNLHVRSFKPPPSGSVINDADCALKMSNGVKVEESINTSGSNSTIGVAEDSLRIDLEELDEAPDLVEVDIKPSDTLESITLKRPNQVYFELYKDARTKAKSAKKAAIIAYLEAKNIKKTYMLENIDDSDSDFDAEIDEVSESELDGL